MLFSSLLAPIVALPLAVLPPNTPLPAELEVCILKADMCMSGPMCGSFKSAQECISDFETCAAGIPEAGEPSCRMTYAWCKLENTDESPDAAQEDCKQAYFVCPSM